MVQGGSEGLQVGGLLRGALTLLLLAFRLSFGELIDKVVANVNGEPILESELRVYVLFYGNEDRDSSVGKLVEKHLITQFLTQQGLNIPEGYIDQLVRDIASRNGKSVEKLYEELSKENLTIQDLKNFLRIEVASTLGLREYLSNRIDVSALEIELERMRKGEVELFKELELLVLDKGDKDKVLKLLESTGANLNDLAESLGVKVDSFKVRRGELVEVLDREVWRAKEGELVVAEDEEHIYLAKVVRTFRVFSGRSEDEVRAEIIQRKIEEEKDKILSKLKKEAFVQVYN